MEGNTIPSKPRPYDQHLYLGGGRYEVLYKQWIIPWLRRAAKSSITALQKQLDSIRDTAAYPGMEDSTLAAISRSTVKQIHLSSSMQKRGGRNAEEGLQLVDAASAVDGYKTIDKDEDIEAEKCQYEIDQLKKLDDAVFEKLMEYRSSLAKALHMPPRKNNMTINELQGHIAQHYPGWEIISADVNILSEYLSLDQFECMGLAYDAIASMEVSGSVNWNPSLVIEVLRIEQTYQMLCLLELADNLHSNHIIGVDENEEEPQHNRVCCAFFTELIKDGFITNCIETICTLIRHVIYPEQESVLSSSASQLLNFLKESSLSHYCKLIFKMVDMLQILISRFQCSEREVEGLLQLIPNLVASQTAFSRHSMSLSAFDFDMHIGPSSSSLSSRIALLLMMALNPKIPRWMVPRSAAANNKLEAVPIPVVTEFNVMSPSDEIHMYRRRHPANTDMIPEDASKFYVKLKKSHPSDPDFWNEGSTFALGSICHFVVNGIYMAETHVIWEDITSKGVMQRIIQIYLHTSSAMETAGIIIYQLFHEIFLKAFIGQSGLSVVIMRIIDQEIKKKRKLGNNDRESALIQILRAINYTCRRYPSSCISYLYLVKNCIDRYSTVWEEPSPLSAPPPSSSTPHQPGEYEIMQVAAATAGVSIDTYSPLFIELLSVSGVMCMYGGVKVAEAICAHFNIPSLMGLHFPVLFLKLFDQLQASLRGQYAGLPQQLYASGTLMFHSAINTSVSNILVPSGAYPVGMLESLQECLRLVAGAMTQRLYYVLPPAYPVLQECLECKHTRRMLHLLDAVYCILRWESVETSVPLYALKASSFEALTNGLVRNPTSAFAVLQEVGAILLPILRRDMEKAIATDEGRLSIAFMTCMVTLVQLMGYRRRFNSSLSAFVRESNNDEAATPQTVGAPTSTWRDVASCTHLVAITDFILKDIFQQCFVYSPHQCTSQLPPARYWRLALLCIKFLRLILRGPLPPVYQMNVDFLARESCSQSVGDFRPTAVVLRSFLSDESPIFPTFMTLLYNSSKEETGEDVSTTDSSCAAAHAKYMFREKVLIVGLDVLRILFQRDVLFSQFLKYASTIHEHATPYGEWYTDSHPIRYIHEQLTKPAIYIYNGGASKRHGQDTPPYAVCVLECLATSSPAKPLYSKSILFIFHQMVLRDSATMTQLFQRTPKILTIVQDGLLDIIQDVTLDASGDEQGGEFGDYNLPSEFSSIEDEELADPMSSNCFSSHFFEEPNTRQRIQLTHTLEMQRQADHLLRINTSSLEGGHKHEHGNVSRFSWRRPGVPGNEQSYPFLLGNDASVQTRKFFEEPTNYLFFDEICEVDDYKEATNYLTAVSRYTALPFHHVLESRWNKLEDAMMEGGDLSSWYMLRQHKHWSSGVYVWQEVEGTSEQAIWVESAYLQNCLPSIDWILPSNISVDVCKALHVPASRHTSSYHSFPLRFMVLHFLRSTIENVCCKPNLQETPIPHSLLGLCLTKPSVITGSADTTAMVEGCYFREDCSYTSQRSLLRPLLMFAVGLERLDLGLLDEEWGDMPVNARDKESHQYYGERDRNEETKSDYALQSLGYEALLALETLASHKQSRNIILRIIQHTWTTRYQTLTSLLRTQWNHLPLVVRPIVLLQTASLMNICTIEMNSVREEACKKGKGWIYSRNMLLHLQQVASSILRMEPGIIDCFAEILITFKLCTKAPVFPYMGQKEGDQNLEKLIFLHTGRLLTSHTFSIDSSNARLSTILLNPLCYLKLNALLSSSVSDLRSSYASPLHPYEAQVEENWYALLPYLFWLNKANFTVYALQICITRFPHFLGSLFDLLSCSIVNESPFISPSPLLRLCTFHCDALTSILSPDLFITYTWRQLHCFLSLLRHLIRSWWNILHTNGGITDRSVSWVFPTTLSRKLVMLLQDRHAHLLPAVRAILYECLDYLFHVPSNSYKRRANNHHYGWLRTHSMSPVNAIAADVVSDVLGDFRKRNEFLKRLFDDAISMPAEYNRPKTLYVGEAFQSIYSPSVSYHKLINDEETEALRLSTEMDEHTVRTLLLESTPLSLPKNALAVLACVLDGMISKSLQSDMYGDDLKRSINVESIYRLMQCHLHIHEEGRSKEDEGFVFQQHKSALALSTCTVILSLCSIPSLALEFVERRIAGSCLLEKFLLSPLVTSLSSEIHLHSLQLPKLLTIPQHLLHCTITIPPIRLSIGFEAVIQVLLEKIPVHPTLFDSLLHWLNRYVSLFLSPFKLLRMMQSCLPDGIKGQEPTYNVEAAPLIITSDRSETSVPPLPAEQTSTNYSLISNDFYCSRLPFDSLCLLVNYSLRIYNTAVRAHCQTRHGDSWYLWNSLLRSDIYAASDMPELTNSLLHFFSSSMCLLSGMNRENTGWSSKLGNRPSGTQQQNWSSNTEAVRTLVSPQDVGIGETANIQEGTIIRLSGSASLMWSTCLLGTLSISHNLGIFCEHFDFRGHTRDPRLQRASKDCLSATVKVCMTSLRTFIDLSSLPHNGNCFQTEQCDPQTLRVMIDTAESSLYLLSWLLMIIMDESIFDPSLPQASHFSYPLNGFAPHSDGRHNVQSDRQQTLYNLNPSLPALLDIIGKVRQLPLLYLESLIVESPADGSSTYTLYNTSEPQTQIHQPAINERASENMDKTNIPFRGTQEDMAAGGYFKRSSFADIQKAAVRDEITLGGLLSFVEQSFRQFMMYLYPEAVIEYQRRKGNL